MYTGLVSCVRDSGGDSLFCIWGKLDDETAFTVDTGKMASIAWDGVEWETGHIWGVELIHQRFGTAMDIRDRFLDGEEIEISVP